MLHRPLFTRVALTLTAAVAGFLIGTPAHAKGGIDSNGYLGGLVGLHVPDYEDTSSRLAWGVVGGAKLGTEFSLGAYYLTSSKEEDNDANQKFDFNYNLMGLEAAYNFEGEAAGAYFGARVGLTNLDLGTMDFQPYHFGLMAGYNHWLTDNFSLGGEAALFAVQKGEEDNVKVDPFNIISVSASVKFWF